MFYFFFSSRRRHTRFSRDWSSDVCSSDLNAQALAGLSSAAPSARQSLRVRTGRLVAYDYGPPFHVRRRSSVPVWRSEERRVGKGVELGARCIENKKRRICVFRGQRSTGSI